MTKIINGNHRENVLQKYEELEQKLGGAGASNKTAKLIIENINIKKRKPCKEIGLNPKFLLPIVKDLKPGTIDFNNKDEIYRIENGFLALLPVKTAMSIPKNLIFDVMKEISKVTVKAPVKLGDVLIENVCFTEIDVIATRDMGEGKIIIEK